MIASCTNLEAALKLGNHSDVIGIDDLCFELVVLKEALTRYYKRLFLISSMISYPLFGDSNYSRYCSKKRFQVKVNKFLSVINHAQKNFSKLKLINSYLRSIMSQEMLNGLTYHIYIYIYIYIY